MLDVVPFRISIMRRIRVTVAPLHERSVRKGPCGCFYKECTSCVASEAPVKAAQIINQKPVILLPSSVKQPIAPDYTIK